MQCVAATDCPSPYSFACRHVYTPRLHTRMCHECGLFSSSLWFLGGTCIGGQKWLCSVCMWLESSCLGPLESAIDSARTWDGDMPRLFFYRIVKNEEDGKKKTSHILRFVRVSACLKTGLQAQCDGKRKQPEFAKLITFAERFAWWSSARRCLQSDCGCLVIVAIKMQADKNKNNKKKCTQRLNRRTSGDWRAVIVF